MKYAFILVAVALVGIGFWYFSEGAWEVQNLPPKNQKIVAYGDSLVEGVGAKPGNEFVAVLSKEVGREILNMGVGGRTSADGLNFLSDVLTEDPGMVILVLGGNDALRRINRSETNSNLDAILRALMGEGIAVVLVGVQGGILGDPYDEMYEGLAKKHGTLYVPDVLDGILLNPELTYDQIHPNDEGHKIVAERIYEVLAPVIN